MVEVEIGKLVCMLWHCFRVSSGKRLQIFVLVFFSFNFLDLARLLAYISAMITANIGQLKDNLSKFLSYVEKGETITICKRNIPIATLVPHGSRKPGNRTKLGCGMGTVQVKGDLTEPLIPVSSWHMHQ